MVEATRLMPSVIGTSTSARPAANTKVSGSSRHRRFFTATARYDGARKTMQHGANRATPPAKNAARTEPVVSRSPMVGPPRRGGGARCVAVPALEELLQFASWQASAAEEGAVEENKGIIGARWRAINACPASLRTATVSTASG